MDDGWIYAQEVARKAADSLGIYEIRDGYSGKGSKWN
jgi:hypothetical protein